MYRFLKEARYDSLRLFENQTLPAASVVDPTEVGAPHSILSTIQSLSGHYTVSAYRRPLLKFVLYLKEALTSLKPQGVSSTP